MHAYRGTLCVLLLIGLSLPLAGDDADRSKSAQKEALAKFNGLIGGWRGTGQPRRGSNSGAWQEKAEWVWVLKDDVVALDYVVTEGKLLKSARLAHDPKSGIYTLTAKIDDDIERTYAGKLDEQKLVLTSQADSKADEVYRITITQLNELRTLVLYEKRKPDITNFSRVAEVGYTRAGRRLAKEGGGQPVCVVTGGLGTIEVQHKGKTYYVCCTGCQQAFEDDPEGILADYAARIAKEKTKP